MYTVNIEQFEGPFDLLLELIESKKLPVISLSLSIIAKEFIGYLRQLNDRSPEEMIQFLTIASRLALLKSRELVPDKAQDEEESTLLLEQELARYKPFRDAAKALAHLERNNLYFIPRESFAGHKKVFYFPRGLKPSRLQDAATELISTLTLPSRIPQATVRTLIPLEKCINELLLIVKNKTEIELLSFLKERPEQERIAHFLGTLELMRAGKIAAKQDNAFGIISLTCV